MISKTIKYEDFDGNQREEDFFFNLNQAELAELQLETAGGLVKYAERIAKQQDGASMFKLFTNLILKSYGEKSDDGKYFRKSEDISNNFKSTNAYDVLLESFDDEKVFLDFFLGIVPKKLSDEIKANIASGAISFDSIKR